MQTSNGDWCNYDVTIVPVEDWENPINVAEEVIMELLVEIE